MKNGIIAAAAAALAIGAWAQQAPRPARPAGGFVPGQERPPEDPAKVARGKSLYGINCTGCHGADLRGGDMGGPNLLRSQVALRDKEGELIVPIIQGSRQANGMPAIQMSPEDAHAVAAYIRSNMAMIGRQGMPPAVGKAPATIVTGDAKAGQAYFQAKCASCHSITGDLKGLAARMEDPKAIQNAWVSGGAARRRGRGPAADEAQAVTAVVTTASGQKFEGRLARIDDFLVTLRLADGTLRSFAREGDTPKVEVRDPLKAHKDLLAVYSDKDIHDVTAYLVTLK